MTPRSVNTISHQIAPCYCLTMLRAVHVKRREQVRSGRLWPMLGGWARTHYAGPTQIQGGPSRRRTLFVDIKLKVPPQN